MTPELVEILRSDLLSFIRKAYAGSHDVGGLEGRSYIEYLACELQPYGRGEPGQLIVNLPPRHLKTFIFAVCLIAWEMGHRPKSRVLVIAGSDRLANDILRQLRQLMASSWYVKVFPTRLSISANKTDLATTDGGTVLAASISGNFTGFGGDLIVVDDAADIAAASDAARLDEINEIFDQKVLSRRNNPAKARVVVIAHRLAEEDLSGHLLAEGDWDHVCLPLVAECDETFVVGEFTWERGEGELLRPGLYSPDQLEALKAKPGAPGFNALQQQNPSGRPFEPLDAECFGSHAGKIHESLPLVISVDPAQASGPRRSYSVAQVWTPWLGDHLLAHQVRAQLEFEALRKALVHLCKKYHPSVVLIEDNCSAQALAAALRKNGNVVELIPVGGRSKLDRFTVHIETIRQGKIKIAEDLLDREVFIDEVVAFPNGANDDQVDALTQYLDYFVACGGKIPPRRPRSTGVVVRRPSW